MGWVRYSVQMGSAASRDRLIPPVGATFGRTDAEREVGGLFEGQRFSCRTAAA